MLTIILPKKKKFKRMLIEQKLFMQDALKKPQGRLQRENKLKTTLSKSLPEEKK